LTYHLEKAKRRIAQPDRSKETCHASIPSLAPRASRLAIVLIFLLGGPLWAQSPAPPLSSGTFDILDSAGNDVGDLTVTATSSTQGVWTTVINGVTNMGTYHWDPSLNAYHSFRNTDPPLPTAVVWWDNYPLPGAWHWREIVTQRTGTLRVR